MSLVAMKPRQPPVALELEQILAEDAPAQAPDINTFMARVFGAPPEEARDVEASSPRTFEVAFEVLKRGSEALGEMQSRCEELQSALEAVTEQAQRDLEASEHARTEWQQLATAVSEKLEAAHGDLEELRQSANSERIRADAAIARAEAAERRAFAMEKVATALHDDILAAFGGFTKARSAL